MTSFAVVILWMSQFCPKVNIKGFRWLDLVITYSNVFFSFVFSFGRRGDTKYFLTFVGGYEIFWGPFWGVPNFLGIFSNTLHIP